MPYLTFNDACTYQNLLQKAHFPQIDSAVALFVFLSKKRLVESDTKIYPTSKDNDFSAQITLYRKSPEFKIMKKMNFLTGAKNDPKPCPNFRV